MQPKGGDAVRSVSWCDDKRPRRLPRAPEAIPWRLQPVQPNPRLDNLHAGHHSPDIPGHCGIPQRQLKGIQPGVLQEAKAANGLSGLLPQSLGHDVMRSATAGVTEMVSDLLVRATGGEQLDSSHSADRGQAEVTVPAMHSGYFGNDSSHTTMMA